MNNNNDFWSVAFIGLFLISYFGNIARFMLCDFEAPYKEEVIRAIGIPFAPIGVIAFWINFE